MPILRNHYGEGWAREIYRDDHAVAFFPLQPATLGHTWWFPAGAYPIFGGCQKLTPRVYLALSCGLLRRYVRLSPQAG